MMDLYLILVSPIVNEPLLSRVQCLSVLRNTGFSMLKFELYISIALYMQLVERIEEDSLYVDHTRSEKSCYCNSLYY